MLVAGADVVAADQATGLRAGAAAVSITPSLDRPVYLAGFGANRRADSVHDPLWARALVLEEGSERIALVGLDLIGLPNHLIRSIRARVRSVPADHVVIACTHVHSGPDTLGLWGPSPTETGRDPRYMEQLEARVAEAIDRAAAALTPATMRLAQATVPDGLAYNARERAVQDKTLTAMQFRDPAGHTLATIVNYGCHPEVMQNGSHAITADFCGIVIRDLERAFGGTGIYLNGALGGMVTPEAQKNDWNEVERVGSGIARTAIAALQSAAPAPASRLKLRSRAIELPLENEKFRAALAAGLLEAPVTRSQADRTDRSDQTHSNVLKTEITRIELGDAEIVTVPGELLPKPGLELRRAMRRRFRFIVGLGQDELGYILEPEQYDQELYHYERGMSVGRQTWPLLFAPLKSLIEERRRPDQP